MGPIQFPGTSFWVTLIALAICGILGLIKLGYDVVIWIIEHVHVT